VGDVQQVTLLRFLGCTADAAEIALGRPVGTTSAWGCDAPMVMSGQAAMGWRMTSAVGSGGSRLLRAALAAGGSPTRT